jgi:cytidylate kinase
VGERDAADSSRATAPLCAAPDAMRLDNSELDPEETLEAALRLLAGRGWKFDEPATPGKP